QRLMILYSSESSSMRLPPPWGIWPLALSKSRLFSGDVGKTRRPRASLTRALKSCCGEKPSSDSPKPFWPLALPWQPPELQPSLVKIGTIWLPKLIGRLTSVASHVTATLTDLLPKVAVIWVVPLASGTTRPPVLTRAILGSATW